MLHTAAVLLASAFVVVKVVLSGCVVARVGDRGGGRGGFGGGRDGGRGRGRSLPEVGPPNVQRLLQVRAELPWP